MKFMKNLLPLFLGLLLFVLLIGCGDNDKKEVKQAVSQELDLLKNLDSDTTQKYIPYQELLPSATENTVLSSNIQEVFSLFFQDFDYKILDVRIAGRPKTAAASLQLTTLDAKSLARDYAAALLSQKIMLASDSSSPDTNDSSLSQEDRYTILHGLLKDNSYETVQTDCTIELTQKDRNSLWEIKRTSALENDLVGGLITYLSDNNLLLPSDTLSVYFDTIKSMNTDEMAEYLGIESLLNAEDTDKSQIASALVEQVHQTFNYEIIDQEKDGYTATVQVSITTFDSDSILEQYQEELNAYLETPEAVIDGSSVRYEKSYQLLLECISKNTSTREAEATFYLINDGVSWRLQDDSQELGNAIFGTLSVSPLAEEETPESEASR
ncbi:MAG: hypothetical protein IJW67_02355 [Blautia sp.]|nr:hypothetical protein [Blautia sp.]